MKSFEHGNDESRIHSENREKSQPIKNHKIQTAFNKIPKLSLEFELLHFPDPELQKKNIPCCLRCP